MVCTLGLLEVLCPVYIGFIGSGVSCVHLVHWWWCVLCTLGSLVVVCPVYTWFIGSGVFCVHYW